MKTFMLIIDGLGDDAVPALAGRTPLQAADAPWLQTLAGYAQKGFVRTVHLWPPDSLACIAGLLGYGPETLRALGRAAFEAVAKGVDLGEGDLVLRCNIVDVSPACDRIVDFTAGAISDAAAEEILRSVALPDDRWSLIKGQSYRNLLLIRDARIKASDIEFAAPHMHQDEQIAGILPKALRDSAGPLAARLADFILRSEEQIAAGCHSTSESRRMLWLWSPSESPAIPSFRDLWGVTGAAVAGLDFMNGLAVRTGMYCRPVAGATGYLDTDYAAKAEAAIEWFHAADFVLLHVNATDEASHARDADAKMRAIECVDAMILGPVFRFLRAAHGGDFSIVVCGDHRTSSVSGLHGGEPVPYLIYQDTPGCGVNTDSWKSDGKIFHEGMPGVCIDSFELLRGLPPFPRNGCGAKIPN